MSFTKKEKPFQIKETFKRVSDEAVNLRVAEKILSEVESRLLKTSPSPFDIETVKKLLQKMKNLSPETSAEEFLQIEFQINQKFRLWRASLEERDAKIETFHLRRFFDFTEEPLDGAFFIALAQFYRNIKNLSKFDLVITRIFARGRGQIQREVRLNRREMTNYLRELFNRWDGAENSTNQFSDETLAAVLKLEEFIHEAEFVESFEELTRNDLFVRLRKFKSELGNRFFEPAIAAAAVECNLAVGNVFNNLMTKANENLSARLTAKYDFAGALQDVSPKAQADISDALREFGGAETSAETEHLPHVLELLELIGGNGENESAAEAENLKPEAKTIFPTAEERLAPILFTLAEPQPDLSILRDYVQKSDTLKQLDLSDFIGTSEDYSDRFCRDVLRVIFLAEELCEHELDQRQELSCATKDEVSNLVQRAQIFGEQLDNLIEISEQSTQNRLLTVSNKLLETRLKLERGIVRFSNRQIARARESQVVTLKPIPESRSATPRKTEVNRRLIAATILVAVICGGFYFFARQLSGAVPMPEDFEKIEVGELPKGEHLQIAHRQNRTLFIGTKDSWAQLSEAEKRENLQNLLDYPMKKKLTTVVVISSNGEPLGDISENGTNLGAGF
jgi:hypothetical protein